MEDVQHGDEALIGPSCSPVSFDSHVFFQYLLFPDSATWHAMFATVWIAVFAQTFGVVFGLVSALAQMSKLRVLRLISGIYVWFFRGTPVIVQIFFVYFGANLFLGFDLFPRTVDLGLLTVDGAAVAGMVALAVNEGAYMSEIIRAGIGSVDRGQMEAAKSVGMPPALAMRRIVLPQAARIIVPPLGNEFNNMLKTTSLLAVHRGARAVPGRRHPLLVDASSRSSTSRASRSSTCC